MVKESNRWMEASDVVPMFPTLVWKLQIEAGLRDALAARILAALADMRRDQSPLEPGQGCQSAQALHEREDFHELVECVRRGVASSLRFLRIGEDAFEITACWATVLAKGGAHKIHSHPLWETGLIGQVLYLEAEAAGIAATGMGCFFDGPVHQVFGFSDLEFQSLYHFTVGGPVEDDRPTTLAPYGEQARARERERGEVTAADPLHPSISGGDS